MKIFKLLIMFLLFTANLMLFSFSALADNNETVYKVYAPVVVVEPVQECGFWTTPFQLDTYLKIYGNNTSELWYLFDRDNTLTMFQGAGTYYIGETHQLNYPLRVYKRLDGQYVLKCQMLRSP